MDNPLVFLNQPIKNKDEDILGSYYDAEIVSEAIDSGAEMIAITSSFGAGKSSITDLLSDIRKDNKKDEIIKVSMWSQLYDTCRGGEDQPDNSNGRDIKEMHKNFLYQLVSQIDNKRGTYVIKKLSSNYDVLSVQTKGKFTGVWIAIVLMLFVAFQNKQLLDVLIPNGIYREAARSILIALAIIISACIALRNEILFSFHKTRKTQDISVDELIDIYKQEVIKRNKCCKGKRRVIVVVEDLDRTYDGNAVRDFLIQLRRYYIDSRHTGKKTDAGTKVTFIVNVAKESAINEYLSNEHKKGHPDSVIDNEKRADDLYEKVFDYIYDLTEINTYDYNYVLGRLLNQESTQKKLSKCGLLKDNDSHDIQGMRWIVRGENLNIRIIKDRLNRSLSKYYVLRHRSKDLDSISFEKCAVVAYLSTTYEKDMLAMDSDFLEKEISKNIGDGRRRHKETINDKDNTYTEAFLKEINNLIDNSLVEADYREYFFNYPENAKVLSADELVVQRALLYGKQIPYEELEKSVEIVSHNNEKLISDAYKQLEDLNVRAPSVIIKNKNLFTIAVKTSINSVYRWFEQADYEAGLDEIVNLTGTMLSFNDAENIVSDDIIHNLCEIWRVSIKPENIIQLRREICQTAGDRIEQFRGLFFGVFPVITEAELDLLPLTKGIKIINQESTGFNSSYLGYVNRRLEKETIGVTETVKDWFIESIANIEDTMDDTSNLLEYIHYMRIIQSDIPELSEKIIGVGGCIALWSEGRPVTQQAEETFNLVIEQYMDFINLIGVKRLGDSTKDQIQRILLTGKYNTRGGLKDRVAKIMDDDVHSISSIIIHLNNKSAIPLNDTKIRSAIQKHIDFFVDNKVYLMSLRHRVLTEDNIGIKNYAVLFDETCGIITEEEIELLKRRKHQQNDVDVISILNPKLVDKTNLQYLADFFNRREQGRSFSSAYLDFISIMDKDIGKEMMKITDFNRVQYWKISQTKRGELIEKLQNICPTKTSEEVLEFMETVKFAEPLLVHKIEQDVATNETFRKRYIELINTSNYKSVRRNALIPLFSGEYCALRDDVSDLLKRIGRTDWFIASRILYNTSFIYEEEPEYWKHYIKLLLGNNKDIADIMSENRDFISDTIAQNLFKDVRAREDEKRIRFVNGSQTVESLEDICNNYEKEFAKMYYSMMKGFSNRDAAERFIDIVTNDNELLESEKIYENTYDKLVDGSLKGRYTRKRNALSHYSLS